jgi:hypothetical protein
MAPTRPQLLLFEYGSNMSQTRLEAQIERYRPHAPAGATLALTRLGAARLFGYRFTLGLWSARQQCLVSDIVEEQAGDVCGVLYRLDRELVLRSDGARSLFDRIEGYRTERDLQNYPAAVWGAYAVLGRRVAADDVAQEAILKAFTSLHSFG